VHACMRVCECNHVVIVSQRDLVKGLRHLIQCHCVRACPWVCSHLSPSSDSHGLQICHE